jgi:diguanylate cyclase (GGDEF)-like protein
MSDDLITFLDEEDEKNNHFDEIKNQIEPWIIGIIDDEPQVHDVTRLALKGTTIYDRPIKFVSAYSAKEGEELIQSTPDMALVLLDVVMETDDAGLQLVDRIRNELGNQSLQIILRTGQAGYAPEEEVIIRYEINSYKTKNELTRSKLFTTIATGLRSYQQLQVIEKSRNGLRAVIDSSATLMRERSVFEFSQGVLNQIDALFDLSADSLFCVSQRPAKGPFSIVNEKEGYFIVAANDKYQKYFGQNIEHLHGELPIVEQVMECLKNKTNQFHDDFSILYLSTPSGWEGVITAENSSNLQLADQEILQIFCMNVALGLENAKFFTYLNKAAFNDELTGLYNRAGLIDEGQRFVRKQNADCSIFILDIDYFHHVVTSMGYEFGSEILLKMASLITQVFGDDAVLSRLHSDVFAVLAKDKNIEANEVALRCSRPLMVEQQSIRMGMTVGQSIVKFDQNIDIAKSLKQAELALNVAKESKRGAGETFNESYEVESRNSMALLSDLRLGLDNNELFLHLQPKVDAFSNSIAGFEALIRWAHPKKGLIPPGVFIPAVEKSGMNYEFDLYVAKKLCEILIAHPSINVPISFNISANSLNHESFPFELTQVFQMYDVNFGRVEIEVTENALINSEKSISRLQELKNSGFKICLDDFGAGFSSLSYLLRLPVTTIKIDRAFVADIATCEQSLTLIEGIVSIINKLNKHIVVEGVENEQQLKIIKGLDVAIIQGFYFYRPLPLDEALALLEP